jgi:serine/threonine-protein kinase SRPK3
MPVDYKSCAVLTDKIHVTVDEVLLNIPLPDAVSLEERESSLEGEGKEKFLAMMHKMLQWEPSKRSSAKELADDEWIMGHM